MSKLGIFSTAGDLFLAYRIENCTGYGPYHTLHTGGEVMESHHNPRTSSRHPVVWDTHDYRQSSWRCGFASLSDLREWFEDWLPWLLSVGFVIRTYYCERVITLSSQIIFDTDYCLFNSVIDEPYELQVHHP